MNEFEEIKKFVEKERGLDGYKAAFLGAMSGWGKSMRVAVRYIEHVTGLAEDSTQHYWVDECETCKEIKKFIEDWKE